MTKPLLSIEGLYAGYRDVPIVHGVNAHVCSGEIVCVIGPNGAGKSTLIKATMGLLKVFEGQILFDGRQITSIRSEQLVDVGIGYVPQVANTFNSLSVRENLLLSLRKGMRAKDEIDHVLQQFPELEPKTNAQAGYLSGGERQMLAFARCLIVRPKLLLLDEPTAALSPLLVTEVFDRIRRIAAGGTAILLVEQNAIKALAISDRAYVLSAGTNAAEDKASVLLANPDIKQLYLGGHAKHAAASNEGV